MKLFKRHLLDSLGALTDIDGLKTVSLHEVRLGEMHPPLFPEWPLCCWELIIDYTRPLAKI